MSNPVESLDRLDLLLNELEAMIQILGDLREDHLAHGEAMTAAQTARANEALWAVELGMTHMHEHYRCFADSSMKERRNT